MSLNPARWQSGTFLCRLAIPYPEFEDAVAIIESWAVASPEPFACCHGKQRGQSPKLPLSSIA
jgi:hypothetical protein